MLLLKFSGGGHFYRLHSTWKDHAHYYANGLPDRKKMMKTLARITLLWALALLSACGGSGGDSSTGSTTPVPLLNSIVVSPANVTIPMRNSQQLVVTANYANNTTAQPTTGVTWSTSNSAVLTVSTTGLVTGKSMGTETVTANYGGVLGSVKITVKGPYTAVASGGGHTIGRYADGSLVAWGANRSGQLGDGTATDIFIPTPVGSVTTWAAISAGEFHSLAVRSDGSLWAWGWDLYGQLGDGKSKDVWQPAKIGSATNWLVVSAGTAHSVGVTKDGKLWGWGRNFNAQLGDATMIGRSVPTLIGAAVNWLSVAAGATHTVGLQSDGSILTWGANDKSQLGQGAPTAAPAVCLASILGCVPGVNTGFKAVAIAAGMDHSLAIRDNGALIAWGSNAYGQLGDSSNTDVIFPALIGTDTDWAVISAGAQHSVAIKSDGSLWAWGSNDFGQLGNGTMDSYNYPVQIGTDKNWIAISAGKFHTFAIKGDGTLWGWGRSADGQLGNGSSGSLAAPVLRPTKLN
jgi:alpha-tubulin suppressor-like RCC1 family protein